MSVVRCGAWGLAALSLAASLLLGACASDQGSPFSAVVKTLFRQPAFIHLAVGSGLVSFVGYGVGQFVSPYLVRAFGFNSSVSMIARAASVSGMRCLRPMSCSNCTVASPMPRFGVFTMRSNAKSSAGELMTRR